MSELFFRKLNMKRLCKKPQKQTFSFLAFSFVVVVGYSNPKRNNVKSIIIQNNDIFKFFLTDFNFNIYEKNVYILCDK